MTNTPPQHNRFIEKVSSYFAALRGTVRNSLFLLPPLFLSGCLEADNTDAISQKADQEKKEQIKPIEAQRDLAAMKANKARENLASLSFVTAVLIFNIGTEEATPYLEEAVDLRPDNLIYKKTYIQHLMLLGEYENANAYLENLRTNENVSKEMYDELVAFYEEKMKGFTAPAAKA